MASPIAGGVDCDLHPAVPHLTSLLPYLNDYWRDQVTTRGMTDLVSQSYPSHSPISARPDWRPAQGKPGSNLEDMKTQALDPFKVSYGICNPLFGVQMVFSEDMQDAFCRALNDWLAKEWLDREPRLRGSIVIPTQSVEKSVAEIERCAKDTRFVQVLMLVMGDMPLGKRAYWPIYAAAERHGLPIGMHAGSAYHNPPTSVGWGSYHIEDYVAQAQAFQTQLTSLIVEGVFARHPKLKMVMLESASPGCRPISGGCTSSGAASAWRRRGSTARRSKLCAAISAFLCSRSTRRRILQPSIACLTICSRTNCSYSRPTIRIGSSTATRRCRKDCLPISCARS